MTKIILNPTAPAAREIDLSRMDTVPDLWHIAMDNPEPRRSDILKVWHLAHDMLQFIRALDEAGTLRIPEA